MPSDEFVVHVSVCCTFTVEAAAGGGVGTPGSPSAGTTSCTAANVCTLCAGTATYVVDGELCAAGTTDVIATAAAGSPTLTIVAGNTVDVICNADGTVDVTDVTGGLTALDTSVLECQP